LEADLIIVIPAFNEAVRLPGVLEAIRRAGLAGEVVVVDDGSVDGTAARAASVGVQVVSHPFNLGYGAAVQTGYKYALERGAEYVVQMDADGQHDPAEIPRLLEPVRRGECDLAIGSRFLEDTGYRMGRVRSLGRAGLAWLGRRAGVDVTDPTSGFQAMDRAVLRLYARDFFPHDYPDIDVLVTAVRHGLRVREVSTRMCESVRQSTLHGGRRELYYAYRMLLALWAASARRDAMGERV
jgi:glycosyltransferase involved in cell wall biosynthesis